MNRISSKLINELDSREFLLNADTITIENQPAMKNPKMKSTSMLKLLMFKPCNVANIFQIEIKKIKKKVDINENSIVFLVLIYSFS